MNFYLLNVITQTQTLRNELMQSQTEITSAHLPVLNAIFLTDLKKYREAKNELNLINKTDEPTTCNAYQYFPPRDILHRLNYLAQRTFKFNFDRFPRVDKSQIKKQRMQIEPNATTQRKSLAEKLVGKLS